MDFGTEFYYSSLDLSPPSSSSPQSSTSGYSTTPSTPFSFDGMLDENFSAIDPKMWNAPSSTIDLYIESLNNHSVNTLSELCRIEKVFSHVSGRQAGDVTRPMTAAWTYYVSSNALLTELRELTRNYPFSAECIEEAKRRVYADPNSNKSWNFCWLVLKKIQTESLILTCAQAQASQPAMWGYITPSSQGIYQLSNAFINEWTWALNHMLQHWDVPPSQ